MYIAPLHCIYSAPSRILAFWLMLSVLRTTLNKAFFILSHLILYFVFSCNHYVSNRDWGSVQISKSRPFECFVNSLLGQTSNQIKAPVLLALPEENPLVIDSFPPESPNNAKTSPYHDIIMISGEIRPITAMTVPINLAIDFSNEWHWFFTCNWVISNYFISIQYLFLGPTKGHYLTYMYDD